MNDKKIDLTKLTKQGLGGQLISEKYGLDLVRLLSKSIIPEQKSLFDLNSKGKLLELIEGREFQGPKNLEDLNTSEKMQLFFQSQSEKVKLTYVLPITFVGALCSWHQGGEFLGENQKISSVSHVTEKVMECLFIKSSELLGETIKLWLDLEMVSFTHQLFSHSDLISLSLNGQSLFHYRFELKPITQGESSLYIILSTCQRLRP